MDDLAGAVNRRRATATERTGNPMISRRMISRLLVALSIVSALNPLSREHVTAAPLVRGFVAAPASAAAPNAAHAGELRVRLNGSHVVTWDDNTSPPSLAQWSTAGSGMVQQFQLADPVGQSELVLGSNTLAPIPAGSSCPTGGYVFANTGGFVDGLADGSTPGVIASEVSSTADFNPQGHPVDVEIVNTGRGLYAVISSIDPAGQTATESWAITNCGLTFVNLVKDPAGSAITAITPTDENAVVGADTSSTNLWQFKLNPGNGRLAIARRPFIGAVSQPAGVDFIATQRHVGVLFTGQSTTTPPQAAGYVWNFEAGSGKPLPGSPASDGTGTDCGGAGVLADPGSNTLLQLLNTTQSGCGQSPDVGIYTLAPFAYAASTALPNAIAQYGFSEMPGSQAALQSVSFVNAVYGEWDACTLAGKATSCSDFVDYGSRGDFSTGIAVV